MKILWFTWKDIDNPGSGGAELVNEEMAKELYKDGHEILFIVGGWKGCEKEAYKKEYKVIRLGGLFTVYWHAFRYYSNNLIGWADIVIDECNTMPFFAKFYVKEKTFLLIQQLAKRVWFYQLTFPFSLLGYLVEPIYLRLLNDQTTFTFAQSTVEDLLSIGFNKDNIYILSETLSIKPKMNLDNVIKDKYPTIIFFSNLRPMKRPHHVIKAFFLAKKNIPNLRLKVMGGGKGIYADWIRRMITRSIFKDSIEYVGPVYDEKEKSKILSQAHYICSTSVREGWGIIISESGVQGTPSIVYDIHGLRDAVNYGDAGLICEENTPKSMSNKIIEAFYDGFDYYSLQKRAFDFSNKVDVNTSYSLFLKVISSN